MKLWENLKVQIVEFQLTSGLLPGVRRRQRLAGDVADASVFPPTIFGYNSNQFLSVSGSDTARLAGHRQKFVLQ